MARLPTVGGDNGDWGNVLNDYLSQEHNADGTHDPGVDTTAVHDNVSGEISAITEKTTPHDDDLLLIEDSQASNAKKSLKVSNLLDSVVSPTLGTWATDGTYYYGPLVRTAQDPTVPALAGWSWINQGSSVAYDLPGGGISLYIPDTASINWRALSYTPPSTPYSAVFYMKSLMMETNSQATGAYFYDGTKLMGVEIVTGGTSHTPRVEKMNSVTSDNSTAYSFPYIVPGIGMAGLWIKLRNSGTTLYFDYSIDGGKFYNMYSEAVGTFITPTKVCFGGVSIVSNSAYHIEASLLGFYMPTNATL